MTKRYTFGDLANRQHGPSLVARTEPRVVKCPDCDSPLDVQTNVETTTGRIVPRIAFCTGCEFVHEF